MIEVLRESKECPQEIQSRLTSIGGLNLFGESIFRLVWGGSRLDWDGGKWTDFDASGNEIRSVVEMRKVPKYDPEDRWYLERWIAPETYGSPEKWKQSTLNGGTMEYFDGIPVMTLGPYPHRGDYEAVSGGCYMNLQPMMVESLCQKIERTRAIKPAVSLAAKMEAHEKKWKKYRDDVYEGLRGLNKPFFGKPFTTVTA